ncbi:MAG TPA: hypothetical protein VI819_04105, partial [Patescibacteria group bacterium]|nr:hypothetical protein [Patescibacteria group bacterium]
TNFVEIYKKTMVVICAVFILFSLGLFFLAYVNISKSMEFLLCRTSINPYKTADDLTGVLSGRSSIGNVFENSSKVFHLRSVSLNMNCDIETIKKDIDKVYECLKNKCVDLDFVEDVKNVPKGDVGNTVKDINIKNPKFKSSSLYKTVEDGFLTSLKDYENYKYINDSLINSIANNDSKSILVFFQNSDIPTSFGGKVEKILLYKFRKNKVEARQELDIDELSKRTVNTDFFNKYVKHYLIRDNSLGLNSFYNYDDLYDILGSVIGNMYGIKIDSVVMVNNKFSETLKSSKLSGKIVKAIEEKDLLYYSHNNTIDKRQTNQVCSQNLALSENSFESDLFNPKRHLDIKINKVNKKYIYNILYAYEDELGIPKKMNITVMLPKNSKNISTNPHTWYEEKNNNNVYLETEIDFMKNKILKLQYETDKPTGECSDFYGFGFITQPGSVYDMKFDFAFDEDYLPLNNSSLTESGTRGYNTTLVGQKSDIYFNFYKK